MGAAEQFDDEKLQNLARYQLYSTMSEVDPNDKTSVQKLLQKDKLDNTERNFLIDFCAKNKKSRPKSMKEMKNEVLEMIGAFPDSSYQNTFSASEMKKLHDWFCENFKKGK